MKSGNWLLLGALLLTARWCAADSASRHTKLAPVAPFPAVCAAAAENNLALAGFDPPVPDARLAVGDTVTDLITLHEKGRITQWLLCFQVATNRPAAAGPPRRPMILYTSTGHHFEFARRPVGIRVRILGPFPEPSPRRRPERAYGDKNAGVWVNQTHLSIGLDQGAAAIIRWREVARAQGGTNFMEAFAFDPKPFGNDRTNHDARLAAQYQVTPAEERAVAGWDPALGAYFNIVGETPNLKDILWKVLSLPSVWSFIKNHGVNVEFGFDNDSVSRFATAPWGLSASTVYSLPSLLTINKHPALAVTLFVAAPQSPLLVCGGVVGFLAENPGDDANYLTLRLLSAHRHASPPSPTPTLPQDVQPTVIR